MTSRDSSIETHFASVDEIHHEIEFLRSLKRILQGDQKGMARVFHQHIAFGHDVSFFSLAFNQGFAHHFHGIGDILGLMPSEIHLAERAFANTRLKFEIIGFHTRYFIRSQSNRQAPFYLRDFLCSSQIHRHRLGLEMPVERTTKRDGRLPVTVALRNCPRWAEREADWQRSKAMHCPVRPA